MARVRSLLWAIPAIVLVWASVSASSVADDRPDYATEVKNRIQSWESDPLRKKYTLDLGNSPPVTIGPVQARALCIGLNHVDPLAYEGWDGELSGCLNDATDMAKIAESQGFEVTKLTDKNATRQAMIDFIRKAGRELKIGDILLVSYSGHGGQVPSTNPGTGMDSTWCLYDGELIDDRVGFELAQFATGVRIIVVMDSCHSGTAARTREQFAQLDHFLAGPHTVLKADQVKELQLRRAAKTKNPFATGPHAVRAIPLDVQEKINKNKKLLLDIRGTAVQYTKQQIDDMTKASVVSLAGCQDTELSMDGEGNGLFTENLKAVWYSSASKGNYTDFQKAILSQMPSNQHPFLDRFGKDTDTLIKQHPFQK